MDTAYNPFDGRAPGGVFTITATWRNSSAVSLFDLHADIAVLTGGSTVLNADDGSGVVGSIITVLDDALGADGILSPGESFTQFYEVGLAAPQSFSFFVNIIGRDP